MPRWRRSFADDSRIAARVRDFCSALRLTLTSER
jgi:hypothetical protein